MAESGERIDAILILQRYIIRIYSVMADYYENDATKQS